MRREKVSTFNNWNWIIISLVITTLLTLLVMYMQGLREIDSSILNGIQRFYSPYPSYIPLVISEFGRANYLLWPQITVSAVLLSHQDYFKTFLFLFMMQTSFFILSHLKTTVCRIRPCDYPGYSFPSGHTLTTTCLYGIVIWLVLRYVQNKFWKYFFVIVLSLFILSVALSRLLLGVHFLTDVIAGFFIGILLVNLYVVLVKFFNI